MRNLQEDMKHNQPRAAFWVKVITEGALPLSILVESSYLTVDAVIKIRRDYQSGVLEELYNNLPEEIFDAIYKLGLGLAGDDYYDD